MSCYFPSSIDLAVGLVSQGFDFLHEEVSGPVFFDGFVCVKVLVYSGYEPLMQLFLVFLYRHLRLASSQVVRNEVLVQV